jgi:hypothetical protein
MTGGFVTTGRAVDGDAGYDVEARPVGPHYADGEFYQSKKVIMT